MSFENNNSSTSYDYTEINLLVCVNYGNNAKYVKNMTSSILDFKIICVKFHKSQWPNENIYDEQFVTTNCYFKNTHRQTDGKPSL